MPDKTEFLDGDAPVDDKPAIPRWNPTQEVKESSHSEAEKKKKKTRLVAPSKNKKGGFGAKLFRGIKVLFSLLILLALAIIGYYFYPDTSAPDKLLKQISFCPVSSTHTHSISVYPLVVGYYHLPTSFFKKKGTEEKEKLPILAFLIEHSEYGYLLYNAGFGEGMATRLQAHSWLSEFLKVEIVSSTKAELAKKGITPDQIRMIFLGSLEWENADGILDFPKAKVYVNSAEQNAVKSYGGVHSKFWKEYLEAPLETFNFPMFAPEDGFLSFDSVVRVGKEDLEGKNDSLVLVPTPGATAGHTSMVVTFKNKKRLVLTGNAAWIKEHITEREDLPRFERKVLRNDAEKALQSICRFWLLSNQSTDVEFICGHDPDLGKIRFPEKVYQGE
ncbi:MAG: hypothetical protein AABZ60_13745 [Planctomycetota bacterium]